MENVALPFQNPRAAELQALAESLSPLLFFGTSTWTYEGWQNLVYFRSYARHEFAQRCLEEYVQFPLFRTVGIDRFFYAPPERADLERYAEQLPEGFPCVIKVWEEITVPRFAKLPKRYGERAGKPNPNYLNADLCWSAVLQPFARFLPKQPKVFVFEFQRAFPGWDADLPEFLDRLDRFLGELPRRYRYAVELRTAAFLHPDYVACLRRHNVAHCFNHWTHMPPLGEQRRRLGEAFGKVPGGFLLCRLLTPVGLEYRDAVARFEPYERLQLDLPSMRREVLELCAEAAQDKLPAFVLVNNRSEGCAPLTIEALAHLALAYEAADGATLLARKRVER
ncbi:MAG: DUF72 domain-containing protein [Candidatus Tectomicrobia bacterium]|nr:DUF72 domain-containing protein [Candidatus Tectomicrobia bacterium]